MGVMGGAEKILHSGFKIVFISKFSSLHIHRDGVKPPQKVHCWLLIAWWWGFEVCQSTLELESVFVVLNELKRDCRIYWNACQTIVSIFGNKQFIWCPVNAYSGVLETIAAHIQNSKYSRKLRLSRQQGL